MITTEVAGREPTRLPDGLDRLRLMMLRAAGLRRHQGRGYAETGSIAEPISVTSPDNPSAGGP